MRLLQERLSNHFNKYRKVLILLGARQVGKTTLVKAVFPDAAYFSVDNEPIKRSLETYDVNVYKTLFGANRYVIIDEIHLIGDPGRCAKIIFDQLKEINLIITGSSGFHIKNKTGESLAGRKIDYQMFPLTFSEYLFQQNVITDLNCNYFLKLFQNNTQKLYQHFDCRYFLNEALLYGLYPDIINLSKDKTFLFNLVDSIIFKDVLELNLIENRKLALNLLKLLAHQIGNLINYSELSTKLNADQRTIKRYIEIFEQSFIIFRLSPYTNNRRDEIIKTPKIFFYDLGIRNTLINDFSSIETRMDVGNLFENFIISEYYKCNSYTQSGYTFNFWRTKQQSEIDLVLENVASIFGIEIKYTKTGINRSFKNHYPEAQLINVTSDNFF